MPCSYNRYHTCSSSIRALRVIGHLCRKLQGKTSTWAFVAVIAPEWPRHPQIDIHRPHMLVCLSQDSLVLGGYIIGLTLDPKNQRHGSICIALTAMYIFI